MESPSDKIIKGHKLLDKLGAGGFGAVYRAHQDLLKRDVAIKLILPEHANKPDFVRRFETEAELIARLEHPHIVPIYDFWRDPDGAYIVMRYISGSNLRDKLTDQMLTKRQIVQIVDQISSALHFAHRSQVVHRDLKPENILIDEDNNAYLVDFGIAIDLKDIDDNEIESAGSLMYVSPDQITGQEITPSVDLYSLGLVVYEMLTGNLPHERTTPHAIVQLQYNQELPENDAISDTILTILRRATHPYSNGRYGNVIEFARIFRQGFDENFGDTSTLHFPDDEIIDLPNPYKGLLAFQEHDSHNFFGRDELIDRLISRISHAGSSETFLAVVGPSGSGKSSVVKAGLVPRIRHGAIEGSENWFIAEMYPGVNPLVELEAALLRIAVNPTDSLLTHLQEDNGLIQAIQQVLPVDENIQVLLVIDQFEELFTLIDDNRLRQQFITILLDAINHNSNILHIVITLRADFYDKPLQYHDFGELLRKRTEIVLPLSIQELEQAIRQPAENLGANFESGLVNTIISAVSEQPGMLPLLQYMLTQLFDQRQGRTLTLQAYEELGGVTGALTQKADTIYDQLPETQQDSIRQLFLRLVTLGEGAEDTRRRVHRTELERIPEIDFILELFGMAYLLTFDHDPKTRIPTVQVAHEQLIRSWDTFKGWVQENRDDLRIHRNLTTATNEWLENERDAGFLARDARLEQFELWQSQTDLVLSDTEQDFLEHSLLADQERKQAEQERKAYEAQIARRAQNFQRITFGLMIVVVAAIFAVAMAMIQSNNAISIQQTSVAREHEANTQVFVAGETLTPIPVTLDAVATLQDESYRFQVAGQGALLQSQNENDALAFAFEAVSNNLPPADVQSIFYEIASNSYNRMTFQVDADWFRNVAFSPDGLSLASISSDTTITIWSTVDGQEQLTLSGHDAKIRSVAYSPDGATLASASDDSTVKLWNINSGQERLTLSGHSDWIRNIAFNPAGTILASASDDNTVKLWNANNGQELLTLEGHDRRVLNVAFSPDGQTLASASSDTTIKLWDANSGQERLILSGHTSDVWSVAFSPDGQTLASASSDNTIKLWNINDGQEQRTLSGHTSKVVSVAFSPDGNTLASASEDHTIKFWNALRGEEILNLNAHVNEVWHVTYSPDGNTLASTGSDNMVKIWNVTSAKELDILRAHQSEIWSVAFSPDGKTLASASNVIKLWDINTRQEVRTLEGHIFSVRHITFSPDGRILASASEDNSVILWNVETGDELATLEGHDFDVFSTAFDPTGQILASASQDNTIKLWAVETAQELATLEGHDSKVRSVAFSPDGQTLASASEDNTVKLWDVESQTELVTLGTHTAWVINLAFSPDGSMLASGSEDQTIKLWDVATLQERLTLDTHIGDVWSVAFSPDGSVLASASSDKSVKLWDTASGQELVTLIGHTSDVRSIAFNPNGTMLASSSFREIRLWNMTNLPYVRQWIQENRHIREFTCAERERFNMPVQCNPDESYPTRTPFATPSPIPLP